MTNVQDFERAWPRIQRSLMRSLRRRRVDLATAEDICQDIAEQALEELSRFRSVRDLVRWGQQAAKNDATDARRAQRRQQAAGILADVAGPVDVPNLARHRAAIDETVKGLFALSPEERAALLATDLPQVVARPGKDGVADKKRRERARARLRGMVKNYPALVCLRSQAWLRKRGVRLGGFGETIAGAGVVAALLAASPLHGPTPVEAVSQRVGRSTIATAAKSPTPPAGTSLSATPRRSSRAASGTELEELRGSDRVTWRPVAEVVSPTGNVVDAGFVDYSEPQPLFCAETHPTGMVCLDPPGTSLPQLPPAP